MTTTMGDLYPKDALRAEVNDALEQWADICSIKARHKTVYDELAFKTFDEPGNVRVILDGVKASLSGLECYSAERLERDVKQIEPLFLNLIPPGETGSFSSEDGTEIASILNIGWLVYLSKLSEFRSKLPRGSDIADSEATRQLQELILKSLEISEIRFTYNEIARNGSRDGENSAAPGKSAS